MLKLRPEDNDFQIQLAGREGVSHFNTAEFRCSHCRELILYYDLVLALELLRTEIGKPLIITSGYRCPIHNKRVVGAVVNSGHTKGYSADIALPEDFTHKLFRDTIWKTRKVTGIKRVGSYEKRHFCHVGIRRKFIGKKHLSPRWGDW